MNISLTPELEKFVRSHVDSGRYLSASEVVREALRLLEARDQEREAKLEALRGDIETGVRSGESKPLHIESIKEKGRKRISKKK